MAPLAAAAWLCALGATGDLVLDTTMGLRVGARRGSYGVDDERASTGEIELLPDVTLARDGRVVASVRYRPRLLLPIDLSHGAPELQDFAALRGRAVVTHDVRVAVDARRETWSLSSSAEGLYGVADLLDRAELSGQVIVTRYRLPYMFARTRAGFEAAPTRRLSYSVGGSASVTGGADDAARSAIPLQRVIQLDAGLRWGMTRKDVLSASLFGMGARVDRGEDAAYLSVGGGWRRLLPPTMTVSGAGGVAATFERTNAIMPWVEGTLSHRPDAPRPSAEIRLAVSPGIDRVTGAIDMTSSAHASVRWPYTPRWTFEARATATALYGWGGAGVLASRPDTLFGIGELRANRQVRRFVIASVSVRSSAQRSDRVGVEEFRELGVFFEVAVRRLSHL